MNSAFSRRRRPSRNWRPRLLSGHLLLGWRGERAAARFLRRKGFLILARNYRCPAGEIDLIGLDGDTIVFIEVKTRRVGDPDESPEVSRRIQWPRIVQAGRYYLMRHGAGERPSRFDVVVVAWPRLGRPTIEHFQDAHSPVAA